VAKCFSSGLSAPVTAWFKIQQFEALQQAIENWREIQQILQRMQALSREVIFTTLPNPPRRKRLSKKILGLI